MRNPVFPRARESLIGFAEGAAASPNHISVHTVIASERRALVLEASSPEIVRAHIAGQMPWCCLLEWRRSRQELNVVSLFKRLFAVRTAGRRQMTCLPPFKSFCCCN